MKKNLVTIRPSDFPKFQWFRVVLPNPMECYNQYIKGRGKYVGFNAYFPDIKTMKQFNLLLPMKRFERELLAIHPTLRQGDPVEFEIKFGFKGQLMLRNWRLLE